MPVTRHWLSWDEPLLPAAARWLRDRVDDRCVDLREVLCITPTARATRGLLAHLTVACEAQGRELVPPRTCAPGTLLDIAIEPDGPVATAAERRLAWTECLRNASAELVRPLLPAPPDADDVVAWDRLAAVLVDVVDALDAGDRTPLDAADAAEGLELYGEAARWRALGELGDAVDRHLRNAGLLSRGRAARLALDAGATGRGPIVLVGVTELPAMTRRLLDARGEDVSALVHAPADRADWFDAYGCPDVERWTDAPPALADEVITFAEEPADQAQRALDAVAEIASGRAPDEITIALADPELGASVRHAATLAGLDAHDAAGHPLVGTPPARLLACIADWLETRRFTGWAALARHPDLVTALEADDDDAAAWPARLDDYAARHLDDYPTEWFRKTPLRATARRIETLLQPLDGPPRPLGAWAAPLLDVLRAVYEQVEVDTSAGRACLALRDVVGELATSDPRLARPVHAAAALRVILAIVDAERIVDPVEPHQVETLAWREVTHDAAPVLVVVGMNDGAVPETTRGDPFLPDRLRRELGLTHNAQRFARDAFVIEAMRHARTHVRVVVGRRNALGDPLLPSRFALAGDDATLRRRVRAFCTSGTVTPRAPRGAPAPNTASRFTVPDLPSLAAPEKMSVTSFRAYLACPYRYALRYLLRLRPTTDAVTELDGAMFGSLAHDVLEKFGRDTSIRDTADADEIDAFLRTQLDDQVRRRFGGHPRAVVRIQVERLAHRLRLFARRQAELRADGWRIVHAEIELGPSACVVVPGQASMPVTGVVDRVDLNERDGRYRIYDYKTGDAGRSPYQVHHGVEGLPDADEHLGWEDLQLPLYRALAPSIGVHGAVEVAFFNLPREDQNVKWITADWTPAHVEHALSCAASVVRAIRAGVFERNEAYAKPFDDFARICQMRSLADHAGEAGEGDAA